MNLALSAIPSIYIDNMYNTNEYRNICEQFTIFV